MFMPGVLILLSKKDIFLLHKVQTPDINMQNGRQVINSLDTNSTKKNMGKKLQPEKKAIPKTTM